MESQDIDYKMLFNLTISEYKEARDMINEGYECYNNEWNESILTKLLEMHNLPNFRTYLESLVSEKMNKTYYINHLYVDLFINPTIRYSIERKSIDFLYENFLDNTNFEYILDKIISENYWKINNTGVMAELMFFDNISYFISKLIIGNIQIIDRYVTDEKIVKLWEIYKCENIKYTTDDFDKQDLYERVKCNMEEYSYKHSNEHDICVEYIAERISKKNL